MAVLIPSIPMLCEDVGCRILGAQSGTLGDTLWLIRQKGLCRKKIGIESRKSWQWLSSSHRVSIVVLEGQVRWIC